MAASSIARPERAQRLQRGHGARGVLGLVRAFEPRAQALDRPLADPHRKAPAGALLHGEVAIDHAAARRRRAARARAITRSAARIAHAGDDRHRRA